MKHEPFHDAFIVYSDTYSETTDTLAELHRKLIIHSHMAAHSRRIYRYGIDLDRVNVYLQMAIDILDGCYVEEQR